MSKTRMNIAPSSYRRATLLVAALAQAAITLSQTALAQNNQLSPVSIEANVSLEWNQTKGMYIAIGDAVVEKGDKHLKADEIIARYDPSSKSRDLTDVSANGSVLFIDGENVARGAKLDYHIGDETYELFGPKAIVTSPRGVMTAAGSIIYNASDNAKNRCSHGGLYKATGRLLRAAGCL